MIGNGDGFGATIAWSMLRPLLIIIGIAAIIGISLGIVINHKITAPKVIHDTIYLPKTVVK